jgi:hypothetical protein
MTRALATPTRIVAATALAGALLAASGSASGAALKPSIRNFLPRTGAAGTILTITGKNLGGATGVRVDGFKAVYTVRSATRITATVPAKAATGRVSVLSKAGTATSTGSFTVAAANGSGTLTTPVTNVPAGSSGNVVVFTYTAATGGVSSGAVTIAVPPGWSAPVTTAAAGCTTASTGTVSTSGQTITVSGLTLAAGATATITYGATSGGACTSSDGATASTTPGAGIWQALEKSWASGGLTNLGASPSITVSAPSGAGTLTTPITSVSHAETGDVITFTYTAAAGGMSSGAIAITVPSGWSAPVTTNAVGCVSASTGTVSTSGQTVTVSGVTLAAGATATITYGAITGGNCTASDGATVGSTTGSVTFATQQASTTGGTLAAIATSPSITVT